MEKTVATLARAERDVLPARGASFLLGDGGQVLFQFVIDTANVIGPRPATDADKATHSGEWTRFLLENPPPPLEEESPPAGAAQGAFIPQGAGDDSESRAAATDRPARAARKR
jgi:hypothetical protein